MEFIGFLREQVKLHPSIQPQDVVKLCYQAAFGAEHLLADVADAKAYLVQEFAVVEANNSPLYEQISADVYRINIAAWKNKDLPADWLFTMFHMTTNLSHNCSTTVTFLSSLTVVEELCNQGLFTFSTEDWLKFKTDYLQGGIRPVHHSALYRANEKPAYRIVAASYIRLIPILEKLTGIQNSDSETFIIAIDGRSASGKTTMSKQLAQIIGAGVVHVDDFYLPQALRTKERLAEPGGNVHYERFIAEVISQLISKTEFTYQIFDCTTMALGDSQTVRASKWRIVEGAYSCHPTFNNYMDLRVFSDISSAEQITRIKQRETSELVPMFISTWIPMEEVYLKEFSIKEQADLIV